MENSPGPESADGAAPEDGDGAAPEDGDGAALEDEDGAAPDPLRFSKWMKRSATGAVLTGIAIGLQEALEPQNKEVPFVIEARGEPDDPDRPIDLKFDPDSPQGTVAIIRRPATGDDPPS